MDSQGGWFGLGKILNGAGTYKSSNSPSLTEQFVLFLESESRRVSEQRTLPIKVNFVLIKFLKGILDGAKF